MTMRRCWLPLLVAMTMPAACGRDDPPPEPTPSPSPEIVFEVDIVYPGIPGEGSRVGFAAMQQCDGPEEGWDVSTVDREPLRRTIVVTCGSGEVRYGEVVYRYPDRDAAEAAS